MSNPACLFLPLASVTSFHLCQCSCLWGCCWNRISDTIRAELWIGKFALGQPTDKVLAREKPDTPELPQLLVPEPEGSRCRCSLEGGEGRVCWRAGSASALLPVSQQPLGDWHTGVSI